MSELHVVFSRMHAGPWVAPPQVVPDAGPAVDVWCIETATVSWQSLLAGYLRTDTADLVFRYGDYGKPYLAGEHDHLYFSLTRSGSVTVLAVANCEVGVDIQEMRPGFAYRPIVERYFTPAEQGQFIGRSVSESETLFYMAWTRKEAVLKATGAGLLAGPRAVDTARSVSRVPLPDQLARFDRCIFRARSFLIGPSFVGCVAGYQSIRDRPPRFYRI